MKISRDFIAGRLREDLIGPLDEQEVLKDYPTDVYLTGILYPQDSGASPENDDLDLVEGSRDEGGTEQDEVPINLRMRAPSFGFSFAVSDSAMKPKVLINFSAARYELNRSAGDLETDTEEKPTDKDYEETETQEEEVILPSDEELGEDQAQQWGRCPLNAAVELQVQDIEGSVDFNQDAHGLEGLRIHVRVLRRVSDYLCTVTAVNNQTVGQGDTRVDREEKTFFQTELMVTSASESTIFVPRPIKWSAQDADSSSAQLLYRDTREYAAGHGCSVTWRLRDDLVASIVSSWIPDHLVPAISAAGDKSFSDLEMDSKRPFHADWLYESKKEDLIVALNGFVDTYQKQVRSQSERINGLGQELIETANKNIVAADSVADRIRAAVAFIDREESAYIAFCLANKAMSIQRDWIYPGEPLVWRPFQLAFILLSLESSADDLHPDRGVADLIWFPTGGGKTEAYLGLIAFVLFYRRLKLQGAGCGVAAIMRYTLRLLTTQQFQRASALVCACETIRLERIGVDGEQVPLGEKTPFSIGLWVGNDATPNRLSGNQRQPGAREILGTPAGERRSDPVQLTSCPMHPDAELIWSFKQSGGDQLLDVRCPNESCHWNQEGLRLPVFTVDEEIYDVMPSLLIGTVDKFAQVINYDRIKSLFGKGVPAYHPPQLIIQDELHLISGPLGTMTGLYETVIDELCSVDGHRPKIVASTATIREARNQIRSLFDREACLFPPPILDHDNSIFAVPAPVGEGRVYLGITTSGRSAKFTLQAVAASLFQSVYQLASNESGEADWYSTLVNYFNSLRELGGSVVLLQDDVLRSIKLYSERRGETAREIKEIRELTSSRSQREVREILDLLEEKYPEAGHIDALLATNMISVGVDISRLGLMIVNGQPKGMAEYIQATSRVGRGKVPGLVVTIYNDNKMRDKSTYEVFKTIHGSLYRDVEATSVTPFSSRARDKALHAPLITLARHMIADLADNDQAQLTGTNRLAVEQVSQRILDRVGRVDPEELNNTRHDITDILDRWSSLPVNKYRDGLFAGLLVDAGVVAQQRAAMEQISNRLSTPTSMRNVEPNTAFKLVRTVEGQNDGR